MRVYRTQHQYYCGVDLHARSLFVNVLDDRGTPGATVATLRGSSHRFEEPSPAERRGFWGVTADGDSRLSLA
jgi:hypothetical protein